MNCRFFYRQLLYTVLLVLSNITYLQAAEPKFIPSSKSTAGKGTELPEIKRESIEREQEAGEAPLEAQISELQEKSTYQYANHSKFKLYGSVRYTKEDQEGDLDDGGSRIGVSGQFQFQPRFWLLG